MSARDDLTADHKDRVLVCSARACREAGVWALRWNNPRIHAPARRKIWLACAGHLEQLTAYLDARDFLRDTVPVSELDEEAISEVR